MILDLLRARVASTSLPASVCRNILSKRGLATLRAYCADEAFLAEASETPAFDAFLNHHTDELAARILRMRIDGRGVWGVARKALNIFMLEATTRDLLRRHYALGRLDRYLEVPLDKGVALGLARDAERMLLPPPPPWPKLMNVTDVANAAFQEVASQVAARRRVHRYQLDLFYWRRGNDERT